MTAFRSFSFFVLAVSLTACVPATTAKAVKKGYDFAAVKRASVAPFQGNGGAAVANEFIRQLVGTGLSVTEQASAADVVISGRVTEYRPNNKILVFLGESSTPGANGPSVVMTNPMISISEGSVSVEGAAMARRGTQMVTVNSTVGVIVQMKDAKTGDIVWADSFGYEGLDMNSATRSTVERLIQTLQRVLPRAAAATPRS